jgi:hypothetical protein
MNRNDIHTGKPIDARVGSIVRWTHPRSLTNGIVIAVRESGHSAHIHWFDHEGHGFYPLDHQHLVLVSK